MKRVIVTLFMRTSFVLGDYVVYEKGNCYPFHEDIFCFGGLCCL